MWADGYILSLIARGKGAMVVKEIRGAFNTGLKEAVYVRNGIELAGVDDVETVRRFVSIVQTENREITMSDVADLPHIADVRRQAISDLESSESIQVVLDTGELK